MSTSEMSWGLAAAGWARRKQLAAVEGLGVPAPPEGFINKDTVPAPNTVTSKPDDSTLVAVVPLGEAAVKRGGFTVTVPSNPSSPMAGAWPNRGFPPVWPGAAKVMVMDKVARSVRA